MNVLLVVNGVIALFAIIGTILIWSSITSSMFFDIGLVFRFLVIQIPIITTVFNLIALGVLYPEFIWFSLLPSLIPIGVISWQVVRGKIGEHEWNKFSSFSPELIREASFHEVVILPEDVRVRILQGKKVDYIINAYSGEAYVELKFIEKHLLRLAQQEFTKHDIDIRVDKKSKPRHTDNA